MSIEVRALTADQWPVWREIRLRSLADTPDAFGSMLEREQQFSEDDWMLRMASCPTVAFVDGAPAALGGFFRPDDETAHIIAMWTDPAFRRRGLAHLILESLIERARAEGRRVVLDVTRGNDGARTTYERAGFVATGRSAPLREDSDLLVDEMVLSS